MKRITVQTRSFLSALALGACLLAPASAFAQHVVIDPWNLVQNVTSAAQSVLMEINMAKTYEQNLLSNMAGLSPSQFTNAVAELGQINTLVNTAKQLNTALGSGASALTNIQALYGASNYASFQAYANNLAARKAAGDANANNLINAAQNATTEIQSAEAAHQQVISALSGVTGPTEAAQATASAVGTVVEQNQAFLGTLSAMATDQGIERAEQSQSDAETTAMESALEQQNAASLAALKANPTLN